MVFFSEESPDRNVLLNLRAPKIICTASWLNTMYWPSAHRITLPASLLLFRLAGHPIHALCDVIREVISVDIHGKGYFLSPFAFGLPDVPIPPLFGPLYERRLGCDICPRLGHSNHLKIFKWRSPHPLTVTSHVWLSFKWPLTDNSKYVGLMSSALIQNMSIPTSLIFNVNTIHLQHQRCLTMPLLIFFPISPWHWGDWTSNITL